MTAPYKENVRTDDPLAALSQAIEQKQGTAAPLISRYTPRNNDRPNNGHENGGQEGNDIEVPATDSTTDISPDYTSQATGSEPTDSDETQTSPWLAIYNSLEGHARELEDQARRAHDIVILYQDGGISEDTKNRVIAEAAPLALWLPYISHYRDAAQAPLALARQKLGNPLSQEDKNTILNSPYAVATLIVETTYLLAEKPLPEPGDERGQLTFAEMVAYITIRIKMAQQDLSQKNGEDSALKGTKEVLRQFLATVHTLELQSPHPPTHDPTSNRHTYIDMLMRLPTIEEGHTNSTSTSTDETPDTSKVKPNDPSPTGPQREFRGLLNYDATQIARAQSPAATEAPPQQPSNAFNLNPYLRRQRPEPANGFYAQTNPGLEKSTLRLIDTIAAMIANNASPVAIERELKTATDIFDQLLRTPGSAANTIEVVIREAARYTDPETTTTIQGSHRDRVANTADRDINPNPSTAPNAIRHVTYESAAWIRAQTMRTLRSPRLQAGLIVLDRLGVKPKK